MKRYIIVLLTGLLSLSLQAQPSWTKKAVKSVFTLKTFGADNQLLSSASGFFVGSQGEAVSAYSPFRGASRAVVIDAGGKELPVECILGADDTYDVAKFRVAAKKTVPLTMATKAVGVGSELVMLPYREPKKAVTGTVSKVETFGGQYEYFTLDLAAATHAVGTPLLNAEGETVALLQQGREGDTLSYAVAARFADSLRTTGLSVNDPALRAINIKKALPGDLGQAQLSLYVGAASLDSAAYASMVEDFIRLFPTAPDGYQTRASMALSANRCDDARRDMERAIEVAADKAEAHNAYSRLILQKELYKADVPFEPWSLDVALQQAEEAYRLSPQPIYRRQQALVSFAKKDYAAAYDRYMELVQTPLRSAELFYEASRCKAMLKDTLGQLALLDSAVATFSQPYLKEAAPYLLARAQMTLALGRYRASFLDLNEYETLMRSQLNANFYFLRYQACVGGRLYQQALDDINKAIELQPKESFYYSEKASLQVRVSLYAEAIETARQLIALAPDQSDGYLFLGLAQCLSDQKAEGIRNLEKARDMGDSQAAGLISRYAQ